MTSPSSFLPIAIRAWTTRTKKPRRGRPGVRDPVRHILVIDTETTIDPTQALLFGAYRYARIDDSTVTVIAEGLIYADDLPNSNPDGYALLRDYTRTNPADTELTHPRAEGEWQLGLVSRAQFTERWIRRVGYPHNDRRDPAMIVMFNAPFDWSRLAVGASPARDDLYGGFSFTVWADAQGNPAPWRPRVGIKALDSKRAIKKFRRLQRDARDFAGHLLDLRTLVFALTGASHSLASACAAFDVEGKADAPEFGVITSEAIDYCRQDVAATTRLYTAAMTDYATHPIGLQPTKAYSPASIAKAYLKGMGIVPRLQTQPDFPPDLLGAAMSAFYGGRAEIHHRLVPLPVRLLDVTSMYPSVDVLMNLWPLVTAATIHSSDVTAEIQQLLARITADHCYNRNLWPSLVVLVQIVPAGDILPVRADYTPLADGTGGWSIGLNPLHTDQPLWYTLPDLIASVLLTGRAPNVLRAVRFTASDNQQSGLTLTELRGSIRVDPRTDDFFAAVVEARQRIKSTTGSHPDACRCPDCSTAAFLKVLANSGSYGIYAEMIRHELPVGTLEAVTVHGPQGTPSSAAVTAPEDPGEFCFPPIAACITGAARLVLALIEHDVTARGGTWVLCDTDSFAIVATPNGGLVACPGAPHTLPDETPAALALSYAEVDEIRARINQLNPYRDGAVTDLLKIDTTGIATAISAKRYVITDTNGTIIKRSLHGLGRYLDPISPNRDRRDANGNPRWIDDTWTWILATHDDPGTPMPEWVDRPALSRVTVSSTSLWRPFAGLNHDRDWDDQIKPFNFLLVATIGSFGHPPGTDPTRFRLIAPYDPNPDHWAELEWRNIYDPDGPNYRITTDPHAPATPHLVIVQSYRTVLSDYRTHPEHKTTGPDGNPCQRDTMGRLNRRNVHLAGPIHLIGKETNRLDDVQAGIVGSLADVVTNYTDDTGFHRLVLPPLAYHSGRGLADLVGVDHRTIDRIRAGSHPRPALAAALTALALSIAREHRPEHRGMSTHALLAAWRTRQPAQLPTPLPETPGAPGFLSLP